LPDGGACKPLAPVAGLPLKGPSVLSLRGDELVVVQNDDGHPRTTVLSSALAKEGASGGAGGYGLPCALAGEKAYCPDRTGAVHRARTDGTGDRVLASGRVGTHITAAELGGVHSAVGYLASRQTTEGWVSEAWMAVDDDPPVRISEDGSGATSIVLSPRGASAMALMLDARSALTAMHLRTVKYEGHLVLGEDVVAFIGGPGDRRTRAALAMGETGPGYSLLPISKDVGQFGLALVRLDDPPRIDEPVEWSMYPNGLDPAPVAAATGGGRSWVARVRPRSGEPGAVRVLELGALTGGGSFEPRDVVTTAGDPADVSLAADAAGTLWVAWVDGAGAWVAHLAC
jgi:hypothetical protein